MFKAGIQFNNFEMNQSTINVGLSSFANKLCVANEASIVAALNILFKIMFAVALGIASLL